MVFKLFMYASNEWDVTIKMQKYWKEHVNISLFWITPYLHYFQNCAVIDHYSAPYNQSYALWYNVPWLTISSNLFNITVIVLWSVAEKHFLYLISDWVQT